MEKNLVFVTDQENEDTLRKVALGLGCKEMEVSGDQNPLDVYEIEKLKEENEELKAQLENNNASTLDKTTSEAIDMITTLLQYVQDECENGEERIDELVEKYLDNDSLRNFGLDEWMVKKEKYAIKEYTVTMTKRTDIRVVVPNDYSESEVEDYLKDYCSDRMERLCENESVEEFEISEYGTYTVDLTKEEIKHDYDTNDLFPGTSEVDEEIF